MTKHQKNTAKLIVAWALLLGLMIALAVSLGGCMAFKPLTIYVTSDTSKN